MIVHYSIFRNFALQSLFDISTSVMLVLVFVDYLSSFLSSMMCGMVSDFLVESWNWGIMF